MNVLFEQMDSAQDMIANLTEGGINMDGLISTHGWNDVMAFMMCLGFLAVYDHLIARGTPGRWFHVHAVANAVTVLFCLPAMKQWVSQPLSVATTLGQRPPDPLGERWLDADVLFHPSNDWAVLMIIAVHTYHCIAFDLSAQDVFHHALFVPTLGIYGGMTVSWGPIRNCLAFFISGLPGGIDYVNLVLLKNGRIDRLTVKRVGSKINVWLRGPGCGVLIPATMWATYTEDRLLPEQYTAAVVLSVFACYNGLYYMEMAVKNYQMHLTRTVLEKSHGEELAKAKTFWEKKEGETKRRKTDVGGFLARATSPIANAMAGDGTGLKKTI